MDATLLVFSLDRAAQADLLLRSFARHLHVEHEVHLLYRASDAAFARGYERLLGEHPGVRPWEESQHTVDTVVRTVIAQSPRRLFGMLVDDDVLIRDVRPSDRPLQRLVSDPRVATASLRLAPRKTWSQPLGRALAVPPLEDGLVDLDRPRAPRMRRWWRRLTRAPRPLGGCWRVPFSLDGNLYLRERMQAFCARIAPLTHVTSVEPEMCKQRGLWGGPLWGAFYEDERLINVVMNNVDTQGVRYPHPGHSVAAMNERYLAGARLDGGEFEGGTFDACHVEAAPRWIDPPGG